MTFPNVVQFVQCLPYVSLQSYHLQEIHPGIDIYAAIVFLVCILWILYLIYVVSACMVFMKYANMQNMC